MADGTTNKQYSATEKTKLAGIEASADVTDAANVDAAGATMNTDTSLAGNGYFLDEDNMASDSATKVPSQQSVKAYTDTKAAASHTHTKSDLTDVADFLLESEVDADIKTLSLPASTTISAAGAALIDDADAAAQRTTLGVDAAGTDNSTDVTLAGSLDYLTLSGQQITRGAIDLTTDVTGILPDANIANDITLDNITQITTRDHGSLQNLTDDDHTIYALLAGRSGGQSLIGSPSDNETLTLTSNSTDPGNDYILAESPLKLMNTNRTFTATPPTAMLYSASTHTSDFFWASFPAMVGNYATLVAEQATSPFGAGSLFLNAGVLKNASGEANSLSSYYTLADVGVVRADGATIAAGVQLKLFLSPTYEVANAGVISSGTNRNIHSSLTIGSGVTITSHAALYIANATGAGTLTTQYGIDVEALTKGGTDIGIRIGKADTYTLQLSDTGGTAAGGITFGTDTNLYRSGANTLKTDDTFVVDSTVAIKAGSSTGQAAKVGGKLSSNTTTVGNVGVGEDDLMTYSVPASTLSVNQQKIHFRASGTIANSINAKRLRVKFGGTTVLDTGAAGIPISAAIQWVLEGEVIRTGAATQKCNANLSTNNATLASYVGYSTAAETLSGAVTLKLTGEAVADNDIVQETMVVEWEAI